LEITIYTIITKVALDQKSSWQKLGINITVQDRATIKNPILAATATNAKHTKLSMVKSVSKQKMNVKNKIMFR
jgi:hypothetical protein